MNEGIIFIFGLITGSFLNVCIHRLPREISVITPSSKCTTCGERVRPWQNIPLVSYLLLKGKCHYCGTGISMRYPAVELLNALFFLALYQKFGLTPHGVFYMAFISSLIVITFIDLDFLIIPDSITLPGAVIGLIASTFILPDPFSPFERMGIKSSLTGLIAGGGVFFIIAVLSRGGMGGGDIKMMAMVGAILGWKAVFLTTFTGSVIGSAYGISLMILKGKGRKAKIPFGPFLAIGSVVSLFFGRELFLLYY